MAAFEENSTLQSELECSICHDAYQDPVQLKCNHNYCRDCLVQLAKSSGAPLKPVNCPICRQKYSITVEEIEVMPVNMKLRNILLAVYKKVNSKPTVCATHIKTDIAYCLTCKATKCLTCFAECCKDDHETEELDSFAAKLREDLQAKMASLNSGDQPREDFIDHINDFYQSKVDMLQAAQDCFLELQSSHAQNVKGCVDEAEQIINGSNGQVALQQDNIKKLIDKADSLELSKQRFVNKSFEILKDDLLKAFETFEKDMMEYVPEFKDFKGKGARPKTVREKKETSVEDKKPSSRWAAAEAATNSEYDGDDIGPYFSEEHRLWESDDYMFSYWNPFDDSDDSSENMHIAHLLTDGIDESSGMALANQQRRSNSLREQLYDVSDESSITFERIATINFQRTFNRIASTAVRKLAEYCNSVVSGVANTNSSNQSAELFLGSVERISKIYNMKESHQIDCRTLIHCGVESFCSLGPDRLLLVPMWDKKSVHVYHYDNSTNTARPGYKTGIGELIMGPAEFSSIGASSDMNTYCVGDTHNGDILVWSLSENRIKSCINVAEKAANTNCASFRIAVAKDKILITIHHIGYVMAISMSGDVLWINKTDCKKPSGLCLDVEDNVFICDINGPSITVLKADGTLRGKLLNRGELRRPWSVAVFKNKLVVLERCYRHNIHIGPMVLKISTLIMNW